MLTSTSYHQVIGNHLVLKSVQDAQDAERLAHFNGKTFGEGVAAFSRELMLHYPTSQFPNWLYVEDETTHEIVSSLGLIPYFWRYEDVTLKVGEMGIVSTLEGYRNRGIVRTLTARFKELLRDGEFDLSSIQGIPYFYRQFGYEYAIPLEAGWNLELHNIDDSLADSPYSFRLATVEDIPLMMHLYEEATTNLHISSLRDAAVWRYLMENTPGTDLEGEFWLMMDADQQPIGYWRTTKHGFGKGLIVSETSRLSIAAAEAVLRQLKPLAAEQGKPSLRFNLPVNNDLLRVARWWGAYDTGAYAWQIHVVDVARLLRKLTPVLERRIANSPFVGLSRKVLINLYREAIELDFKHGKLLSINNIGFCDGGDIRIPPMVFTPLLLGYRSHEELRQSYPDVNIWGQARGLVDALFPKLESFIFTVY